MTPEPEDAGQPVPQVMLTVSAVARRLGVAPSTLRTWDRRYGLGPSAHSAGSHRRYSPADVSRLVVMRGLVNEGVPPVDAAQIALAAPVGAPAFAPLPAADTAGEPVAAAVTADDVSPTVPFLPVPSARYPSPGGEHVPGDEPYREATPGPDDVAVLPETPVLPALSVLPADDRLPARFGSPLDPRLDPLLDPRLDPSDDLDPPAGLDSQIEEAFGLRLGGHLRPLAPSRGDGVTRPAPVTRAGGGRVVSLPDASPRARGLARAAMALDTAEVTRVLREAIAAYGVMGAWNELALPVLQGLGERWRVTGEGVEVEHALSESLLGVLRGVSATLYRPRNVRPVLLTCADGDYHSLPLHVLAAALAEQEVGSRLLGVGLPAQAMVAAVRRTGPAAVFVYARIPVLESAVLGELPRQRPAPRVVVGGRGWEGVALPPGVVRVDSLHDAVDEVLGALHV